MSIVLNPWSRHDEWRVVLSELLPDHEIRLWPDVGDPDAVEFVIAWRMPRADLQSYPNLRAILSLGAGTEQWQRDGTPDVPVVRLADPAMSDEMAAYALHWVLHFQRRFDEPADPSWTQPDYTQAASFHVGILGYGTIGARVGEAFSSLGYGVNAWSRSGGDTPGVRHFAGDGELEAFLAASNAVVNVLPSTVATTGLLDAVRFGWMAPDSIFVNMGRGTVVVEEALLGALDSGHVRAAVLDVTDPEPAPEDSPLWSHDRVHLTPHVAGSTQVVSASRLVADNIVRIRSGEEPFPLLDRTRGY